MTDATDRVARPDAAVLLPALAALPGHLFWRASARVTAALADALPPAVDFHAYAVLLALADGAPRSQQELADTVSVSRTTMARVARELVAGGLVDRVRNPRDRRSYALTRTPAGAAAAVEWRRYVDSLEDALTHSLDDVERADFAALLLRLVQADLAHDLPAELRTSTGFLLVRAHATKHRVFEAGLEPLGLEPRHFGSLRVIGELGPVPQAELARHLGVSGATTVEIVDSLEALGLVERRRSAVDRRTHLLHLLPAADVVVPEAGVIAERTASRVLAVLDDAERTRLLDLLRRFVVG